MYGDLTVISVLTLIFNSHPTYQSRAGFQPHFDTTPVNITVIKGKTAYLNCSVYVDDIFKVAWLNPEFKVLTDNERRIIDDIRITMDHTTLSDWNLHIRNIQYYDEGVYSCSINTDPVQTKKVYLKVLVPAEILRQGTSGDVKATEGTTVQLFCNVTGIPPPTVQWFRHISSTDHHKATKEAVLEPGEVLIIHNISRYCGGTYECVAYNRVDESDSHKMDVDVVFRPEIELPTRKISQSLHKETILQCKIRANPLQSAEWQRNGIPIYDKQGKFRIEPFQENELYTNVLNLNILSIGKEDFGNYTCVALNSLGRDEETMTLHEYVVFTKPAITTKTVPPPSPKPSDSIPPYVISEPRPSQRNNADRNRGLYRPRSDGKRLTVNYEIMALMMIILLSRKL